MLLSSFLHLSCNELAPFGHYEPLNTNLALEIRDQTTEKENLVNETVFKTFFDITTTTTYRLWRGEVSYLFQNVEVAESGIDCPRHGQTLAILVRQVSRVSRHGNNIKRGAEVGIQYFGGVFFRGGGRVVVAHNRVRVHT